MLSMIEVLLVAVLLWHRWQMTRDITLPASWWKDRLQHGRENHG